MNLHHYIWSQLCGYILHPDIVTDLSQARIADVGTGTGFVILTCSSHFLCGCQAFMLLIEPFITLKNLAARPCQQGASIDQD